MVQYLVSRGDNLLIDGSNAGRHKVYKGNYFIFCRGGGHFSQSSMNLKKWSWKSECVQSLKSSWHEPFLSNYFYHCFRWVNPALFLFCEWRVPPFWFLKLGGFRRRSGRRAHFARRAKLALRQDWRGKKPKSPNFQNNERRVPFTHRPKKGHISHCKTAFRNTLTPISHHPLRSSP